MNRTSAAIYLVHAESARARHRETVQHQDPFVAQRVHIEELPGGRGVILLLGPQNLFRGDDTAADRLEVALEDVPATAGMQPLQHRPGLAVDTNDMTEQNRMLLDTEGRATCIPRRGCKMRMRSYKERYVKHSEAD